MGDVARISDKNVWNHLPRNKNFKKKVVLYEPVHVVVSWTDLPFFQETISYSDKVIIKVNESQYISLFVVSGSID